MSKIGSATTQSSSVVQQKQLSQESTQVQESKKPPSTSTSSSIPHSSKASSEEVRSRISEYQIGGQARQAELLSKLPADSAKTVLVGYTDGTEDYGTTGGEEDMPPSDLYDNSDWIYKEESEPESEVLRVELMVEKQTQALNEMLVDALKQGKESADAKAKVVQDKIDRFDKKGAIQAAAEEYGIDTSSIKGNPKYDKALGRLEGKTFADGTVKIGEAAFRSPGWLASTIGHESLHAKQIAEGRWYTGKDPQGEAINEVESYDWELANAANTGLTTAEVKILKGRRNDEIAKLDPVYQQRVQNGNYSWP